MNSNEHISVITRILSGNADASDRLFLDRWLSMSTENQKEFESFQHIWDVAGRAKPHVVFNTSDSWNKLNTMISCVESEHESQTTVAIPTKTRTLAIGFYLKRVAAIFVLAFGLYYLFNKVNQPEIMSVDTNGLAQMTTQLPDGTQVVLNQSSHITYPDRFANNQRLVAFEGEGLFEVVHNPEKPMIIETGNLRVKVLGTSFDLINYPQSDEVLLYLQEGKVLFYSINPEDGSVVEQIVLTPGQKGFYNKKTNEISKDNFCNNNYKAWTTGILEFDKTPLSDVFAALEKTYGIAVQGAEPYQNMLLTARYQDESIESIFQSLQVIFGIEFTLHNNQVTLQ